jgi:predicted component of type VI protein secretion system
MIGTVSDIRTKTKEEMLTQRSSEQPFRIALVGDFSGRASRGEAPRGPRLSGVAPLLVDSDNLTEVMERLDVRLGLARETQSLVFQFRELDDFHPDKLYATDVFEALRNAREQAAAPSGEAAAGAAARPAIQPHAGLLDEVVEHTQGPALGPEILAREQAFDELILTRLAGKRM